MAPANNAHHLVEAAARRSADARKRAEDTLLAIKNSSESINTSDLAKRASVSRSWLYSQADLIAAVREINQQAQAPQSAPATDRSLQVRLVAALGRNERLQQRVKSLTEQNDQQRLQLEHAYAEIRRLQAQAPGSITRS